MKATLTVSRRGVVTLPAKLRAAMGIEAEDLLVAETTPDGILLRPAVALPVEIYDAARIAEFEVAEAEAAAVLERSKARPKPKAAPRPTVRSRAR